ncbi:MAG: tetratricopeptide repeat protein [Planctomycetes bacterium]|nr:tetratricopeptide repeat protein [Planctomycetota bacterium]
MDERQVRRLLDEAEGYRILGAHTEALRRIEEVEGAGGLPVEAAFARGEYHRDRGEFAPGRDAFRRVLAARPSDVEATVGLGWCEKRLGNVPGAVQAYREAVWRHPNEPILPYNLACYLSLLGQREESLQMLERALRLRPAFQVEARSEPDFDPVRDDPRFGALTSGA